MDPLAGSRWSQPGTVAGFAQAPPNDRLMRVAADELQRVGHAMAVDIGCGAGRNGVPLAAMGWDVVGIDLSRPMLAAASDRAHAAPTAGAFRAVLAAMDRLPLRNHVASLIVAHGIWNLARSAAVFRAAVREAARVARPDAHCFVFTFSRNTLSPAATPVAGEPFVFTDFSGEPQCFLTEGQLQAELAAAGLVPDPGVLLVEHNLPRPGALPGNGPVIYEGGFRVRHSTR